MQIECYCCENVINFVFRWISFNACTNSTFAFNLNSKHCLRKHKKGYEKIITWFPVYLNAIINRWVFTVIKIISIINFVSETAVWDEKIFHPKIIVLVSMRAKKL